LTAEGWTIEIDSAKVRIADGLRHRDLQRIDWFDLNVSATFDDVRVGLPELLASADTNRSLFCGSPTVRTASSRLMG